MFVHHALPQLVGCIFATEVLHDGITKSQRCGRTFTGKHEPIALHKGWITPARVREIARPMAKNQYGQYLLRMADEAEK